MTRQLASYVPMFPGLVPDADTLALARSFHTVMEGYDYLIDRMPTTVERQQLAKRVEAIDQMLLPVTDAPQGKDRSAKILADLLMGYPFVRSDPNNQKVVATYVYHLAEMPLFAIERACSDVKNNLVYDIDRRTGNHIPLNPNTEPSTSKLKEVAEKHRRRIADEKAIFDRVLNAKKLLPQVLSAEARRRVGAKAVEVRDELRRRLADKDLLEEKARAERTAAARVQAEQEIVAEHAARGTTPPTIAGIPLSVELASRLGLMRPAPER